MSMINFNRKRKYERKLMAALNQNQDFLVDNLRGEWEEIDKLIRRKEKIERIVELTKKSGMALGKAVLGLALVGGVLTMVMVAPKIFTLIGRSNKEGVKYKGFFSKSDLKNSMKYLKYKKYIKIIKKDNEKFEIYLEKKGKDKIIKESFHDLTIPQPIKWDGYWRIIIFDIPEKHKWAREGFREKLRQLNFYQLQESVFVIPYNCRKEIEFLCSIFNISDYVRFIKTNHLVFDDDIKDIFKV